MAKVVRLQTFETYTLRTAVLRDNTPTANPQYDQDDDKGTIHLGIYDFENPSELIGTSSWVINPWHGDSEALAFQIRGMAVAKHKQKSGLGKMMLNAGMIHAEQVGAKYIWAKARDSAIHFYTLNGFEVFGDGFIDENTALPHHLVVRSHLLKQTQK